MIVSKFAKLISMCVLTLSFTVGQPLQSQAQTTTRNLVIAGATQSIDASGRVVLVSKVHGDLSGVLTLALTVGPNGAVSGGEWALNLSYIQYGPGVTRDGDPAETLVKLGVLKGTVTGGSARMGTGGLVTDLNGVQLNLKQGTMTFAGTASGSGTIAATLLDQQTASSGYMTLNF